MPSIGTQNKGLAKTGTVPRMAHELTTFRTNRLQPSGNFLGRPSWKFKVLPEPATNPTVNSWLLDQMEMQEAVIKRLETIRKKALLRANKRRVPAKYEIGDMVLVHKQRFPQRHVPKLESPW